MAGQIWADRFDDSLEDVFALQDKVALSVAGVIEPAVKEAEMRRVSRRPTESLDSYDLYLRALPLFRSFRKAEMLQALDLINRALVLDPILAIALASGATGHMQIITFGWSDDPERHRRLGLEFAGTCAGRRRQRRASAGAGGHCARSWSWTQPPERAAAIVDRAAALNPGSASVWFFSGMIRATMGDAESAYEQLERARRLDPLSFTPGAAGTWMAIARFEQGRFDEALALIGDTSYRNPVRYAVEAALLGHLGRSSEARAALELYRTLTNRPIEELAAAWFQQTEHRLLLLEGVAKAQPEPLVSP